MRLGRKKQDRFIALFLIFSSSFYFTSIEAVPAQILLIRHAEKPDAGIHLSKKGRERAQSLVSKILETPELNENGPPVAIYAQKQAKNKGSVRSIETVTPLAETLGIEINTTYQRDEYAFMVDEILNTPGFDGKVILISWGHTALGQIALALGAEEAPREWPDVYDRIWVLTYEQDNTVGFSNIPQKLLRGDSQK